MLPMHIISELEDGKFALCSIRAPVAMNPRLDDKIAIMVRHF